MITTKEIQTILSRLSNKAEPYLSEAQFQFELAWELQKIHDDCKILLEYTACSNKTSGKRFEYDIIAVFDEGYQAIELKYKTTQATINGVDLIQQAGQPGVKYDYLWDIHRIEILKNRSKHSNDYYYYLAQKDCLGGFAILLTNDASYWCQAKPHELAFNFSLHDTAIKTGHLDWNICVKPQKNWMKSRCSFSLDNSYTMQWNIFNSYCKNGKKKQFKYLLTEI